MRAAWVVLVLAIAAASATLPVRVGSPSSAIRLPRSITVSAVTQTPARTGADRSVRTQQPVEVVTPDHPVASVPAPSGSDSREVEQLKRAVRPTTTTAASDTRTTDR